MNAEIKSVLTRASATLARDALGLASIVVAFIVALHLPGSF